MQERTRHGCGDVTLSHVEFHAPDAPEFAHELRDRYGLTVQGSRTDPDGAGPSMALGSGRATIVVTGAGADAHPATRYAAAHGPGVADIALRTADARAAYAAALANGARGVRTPVTRDGGTTATIAGFGDVLHTFVQPPRTARRWLPGFGELSAPPATPTGIDRIDHLAVCLPAGRLAPTAAFYEQVLGFRTTFTERIEVGAQAMESQVVQSASGDVTFTLIEPDPLAVPGQIDRFLTDHGGAGVQHVAFATLDIVRSTSDIGGRGVEFLAAPAAYYDRLSRRLEPVGHPLPELRRLNILADEDHDGQLYQIFARSTHPRATFFFELIERLGARTFGSGNIKALYESVEAEGRLEQIRR